MPGFTVSLDRREGGLDPIAGLDAVAPAGSHTPVVQPILTELPNSTDLFLN